MIRSLPLVTPVFVVLISVPSTILAVTYSAKPGDDLPAVVDRLRAGDSLHLAKGNYQQSIAIRAKGTEEHPIRIDGDGQAVFSGLIDLRLEWQPHRNEIYKANVDHPVRQLFVDGRLMTPARWPNMTFYERWDNSKWPAADEGARYGRMVDNDLAISGIDFTGCVAVLNIGSWQTFRRVITHHSKGQDCFIYPTDPESRLRNEQHPAGMDRYCIYGEAALDAPGEWFFDGRSSTLFFYPPDESWLDKQNIQSKNLTEAVVVEESEYIEISGIQFHGTTFRLENSDHCTLDGIDIRFGSSIANPFGPNVPHPAVSGPAFSARKWFGETSVDALTQVTGDDNVVRNLTVQYSEGPSLTLGGKGNLIENCLFKDNDWHGLDYGFGIDLLAAPSTTVRHVTLDHCGGSEGLRLSNSGPSLVEYCHLHHCGLRQSDGAIIQASTAGVAGTVIRNNWIHDHNAFHWGGNGIRGDDGTRGLLVHHNVVWNCREKGIVTKGDNNRVYHNTCFDNPRIDILMPRNRLPGKSRELTQQNVHSEAFNNLAQITGSWIWEKPKQAPYGKTGNNLDVGVEGWRSPSRMDFRHKPNSPAIDAGCVIKDHTESFHGSAPDVGAHESGDTDWEAGYRSTRHD